MWKAGFLGTKDQSKWTLAPEFSCPLNIIYFYSQGWVISERTKGPVYREHGAPTAAAEQDNLCSRFLRNGQTRCPCCCTRKGLRRSYCSSVLKHCFSDFSLNKSQHMKTTKREWSGGWAQGPCWAFSLPKPPTPTSLVTDTIKNWLHLTNIYGIHKILPRSPRQNTNAV